MKLNESQLHILQHSLGVDKYGRGSQYRNHYCHGVDSKDSTALDLKALCDAGLMRLSHAINDERDGIYIVTMSGIREMYEQSPKPPKISKSSQRYHAWLRGGCSMRFGDWLKEKRYKMYGLR